MRVLLPLILIFSFSFAKYDVIYNNMKLGEIQNLDTIENDYIEIDVTSKLAKLFLSKDKFIYHTAEFDESLKNDETTKYKKDRYQILNIVRLSTTKNITYEKFIISENKYIELWFDGKFYFRYTSRDKLKSEGYLIVKDHILQSLVDTRNKIKIVLN
jgi:hypothetical protein